jgi:hypothetical protein
MPLRWLRTRALETRPPMVDPAGVGEPATSRALARALELVSARRPDPEVLDLGQPCRSAALHLAHRGARVCVEAFHPPAPVRPAPAAAPAAAERSLLPIAIPQPDERFDLVLAWEHADFVAPDRLAEFGAELRRVLAPGGWLMLFAQDHPAASGPRQDRAGSYRVAPDDSMVRSNGEGPLLPRWVHPNRLIEQALAPLLVQSIRLQPNRIREFLVQSARAR